MGYFNLSSILYNLRKIFKYLSFSLLIVAFVVLALLLMGKDVNAYGEDRIFTIPPQPVIDYLSNTTEFRTGNYDFFIFQNGQSVFTITLIEKSQLSSNLLCYMTGTTNYRFNNAFSYKQYSVNPNGQYLNEASNVSNINSVWGASYNSNGIYYWYSSFNVYSDSSYNTLLYQGVSSFEEPYIALPNDSTDNYINGEFGGFMVVAGHDVVSDNPLNVLDFFYTDYSEEYTEQNTVVLRLDKNSPYYLNNYENNNVFIIPKNVIPYLDGHEYYIQLQYFYNNIAYQSDAIQWTTAFSEQAILNDQIRMQDSIDNINGFLNNDKYNNGNIINNMPNSNQYTSPTDSGIDSIFTALYNAFTTNQTQTVRFVIPFTNEQYIDIPSDLVTSRLPQAIIILIQSVYWYVICRYIIKDIANIAEKAKSGEILDGSSDGNIKTDLL